MHPSHTLSLIRQLTAIGVVKPRRRVGRWPAPVHPDLIGNEYTVAIVRMAVDPAHREMQAVLPEILALLVSLRREQGHMDADPGGLGKAAAEGRKSAEKDTRKAARSSAEIDAELRAGSEQGRRAARLIDHAAAQVARLFHPGPLHDVVHQFGNVTDRHSRLQLDQQLRTAIGVPLSAIEKPHRDRLEGWAAANVDLIVTLPPRYFDDVRGKVLDAFEGGMHPYELADEMQEAYGNSEWEAERIARDQTLTLAANLNEDRMTALGVTEYVWRTVSDGRVRDNHADLDGQRFSFDDPPMGGGTSADEAGNPGDGILCVPGDAPVSLHALAVKAYRRRYRGDLTALVTDADEPLRVTPNHPVLTRRGWLAAHLVEVGDYLVEAPAQRLNLAVVDPQRRDPTAAEMFGALQQLGVTRRVVGAGAWFHGDGSDEQVDIVEVDRRLLLECLATRPQEIGHDDLAFTTQAASSASHLAPRVVGADGPMGGIMSGAREGHSLLVGSGSHADEHGRASSSRLDTVGEQHAPDGATFALHRTGDSQLARAAQVGSHDIRLRQVKAVVGAQWDGWVYNFETDTGWFSSHDLIIHNCRCFPDPVLDDLLA